MMYRDRESTQQSSSINRLDSWVAGGAAVYLPHVSTSRADVRPLWQGLNRYIHSPGWDSKTFILAATIGRRRVTYPCCQDQTP